MQAGYAKNGQHRSVPMNSVMHAALSRLRADARTEYVFTTRTGVPYTSIRNGFQSACGRAGLEGASPAHYPSRFCHKIYRERSGSADGARAGRMVQPAYAEEVWTCCPNTDGPTVETLVKEFHNTIPNSAEQTAKGKPITPQKSRFGEVAEWPKATVC